MIQENYISWGNSIYDVSEIAHLVRKSVGNMVELHITLRSGVRLVEAFTVPSAADEVESVIRQKMGLPRQPNPQLQKAA